MMPGKGALFLISDHRNGAASPPWGGSLTTSVFKMLEMALGAGAEAFENGEETVILAAARHPSPCRPNPAVTSAQRVLVASTPMLAFISFCFAFAARERFRSPWSS